MGRNVRGRSVGVSNKKTVEKFHNLWVLNYTNEIPLELIISIFIRD